MKRSPRASCLKPAPAPNTKSSLLLHFFVSKSSDFAFLPLSISSLPPSPSVLPVPSLAPQSPVKQRAPPGGSRRPRPPRRSLDLFAATPRPTAITYGAALAAAGTAGASSASGAWRAAMAAELLEGCRRREVETELASWRGLPCFFVFSSYSKFY